ncbi:retrotransposon protein, putative, ty1-copia subclass [Tanacetum coccineum]|uniref:Retrotransposon protein, putative, ty1-copia subclass n=1 Tax=Tanacetum coccineum TaxID=301880 RepID=A0ABQ5ILE6_9ASTR
MDGIVHTYKARLVAKGYTQTYEVDYEETFSPVANIRAIRILIAKATLYDYDIWKMDVKTAFINGYLNEDIYMVQLKGFIDPNHPEKFKMENSKRGNIPMQERFALNKTQGASTPEEVKHMQNVPYASDLHKLNNIVASEAVWIRKFILGLGIVSTINEPIKIFCDNSAALLIANEPGVQRGAKHYHRRYHYVRECIKLGEINLLKVHTYDNLADPFTKALPKGKLTQHARSMGLRLASSFM